MQRNTIGLATGTRQWLGRGKVLEYFRVGVERWDDLSACPTPKLSWRPRVAAQNKISRKNFSILNINMGAEGISGNCVLVRAWQPKIISDHLFFDQPPTEIGFRASVGQNLTSVYSFCLIICAKTSVRG